MNTSTSEHCPVPKVFTDERFYCIRNLGIDNAIDKVFKDAEQKIDVHNLNLFDTAQELMKKYFLQFFWVLFLDTHPRPHFKSIQFCSSQIHTLGRIYTINQAEGVYLRTELKKNEENTFLSPF